MARDVLPDLVQPLFETTEVTVEQALNEQIEATGFEVWKVQTNEDSLTLGLRGQG